MNKQTNKFSRKLKSKLKKRFKYLLSGLFLSLASIFLKNVFLNNDYLEVYFLDVGQGDSQYIKTPNNKAMIIDGGPKGKGENIVAPFLRQKGISDIDCIVVSHFHDDHCSGCEELLPIFNVKNILIPKCRNDRIIHDNLVSIASKTLTNVNYAETNKKINVDEALECNILYSGENSNGFENDNSIVIKMIYGKTSILFTGDIEKNVENLLLSRNDLKSTILKSPHHGSNTSNTFNFLKMISPEFIVINVASNNKYHHPHPSVIKNIEKFNVKLYRTDKNSTIKFVIDSEKVLRVIPLID